MISRNIAKIVKDQKPTKGAIKDYDEKRKILSQTNMQTEKERIFEKKNGYNRKTLPKQRIQNFYQEVRKTRQTMSTRTAYCKSTWTAIFSLVGRQQSGSC